MLRPECPQVPISTLWVVTQQACHIQMVQGTCMTIHMVQRFAFTCFQFLSSISTLCAFYSIFSDIEMYFFSLCCCLDVFLSLFLYVFILVFNSVKAYFVLIQCLGKMVRL